MHVHELTPDECAALLGRNNFGRIGCAKDGQPYVVPIQFSYDGERQCVYSFSTVGQKIEWMRANPRVCLQVDEIDDKFRWTSVVVFGLYEEIHESPAEADARRRAESLFQQRPEWWQPAAAKVGSTERSAVVVFRITIERMTGRRAARRTARPGNDRAPSDHQR
jgi:nitroimidazol reductase NimA-like FMN-containing flavoprotein (pyridoxamine 5'-phosphate oxidase superfamily)